MAKFFFSLLIYQKNDIKPFIVKVSTFFFLFYLIPINIPPRFNCFSVEFFWPYKWLVLILVIEKKQHINTFCGDFALKKHLRLVARPFLIPGYSYESHELFFFAVGISDKFSMALSINFVEFFWSALSNFSKNSMKASQPISWSTVMGGSVTFDYAIFVVTEDDTSEQVFQLTTSK